MTSPDPNADETASTYNVQIGEGQGIVIGDNPHVVQQFYGTPTEPQVDLAAAEATYRQKVVDAYKWLNFSGFDSPDLSLANVPLEEVFVRLTPDRGESHPRARAIGKVEPGRAARESTAGTGDHRAGAD